MKGSLVKLRKPWRLERWPEVFTQDSGGNPQSMSKCLFPHGPGDVGEGLSFGLRRKS